MAIIVTPLNRADKATAKHLALLGEAERQKLTTIANRAHSGGATLSELDTEKVVCCSTPEEIAELVRRCRDIAAMYGRFADGLEALHGRSARSDPAADRDAGGARSGKGAQYGA